MAGISRREHAQRTRQANECRALNPCTIERQPLREQQEQLQNRTFHPFLRLTAELKLRVVELADLYSILNLAVTCRTMWSLWTENSEVVWNVILKERFQLEARVVGPAESFPSFGDLAGRKERSLKPQRTPEQEAAIYSAAKAVVMRRSPNWENGGIYCTGPMTELSIGARRGGFGYLKLLDEISRCVDADLMNVKESLASAGMTDIESFRSAVMLLWRMRWWRIENVPDQAAFIITRKRFRVQDDDERIKLVTDEPMESKKQFKLLLEVLLLKLGASIGVDRLSRKDGWRKKTAVTGRSLSFTRCCWQRWRAG